MENLPQRAIDPDEWTQINTFLLLRCDEREKKVTVIVNVFLDYTGNKSVLRNSFVGPQSQK